MILTSAEAPKDLNAFFVQGPQISATSPSDEDAHQLSPVAPHFSNGSNSSWFQVRMTTLYQILNLYEPSSGTTFFQELRRIPRQGRPSEAKCVYDFGLNLRPTLSLHGGGPKNSSIEFVLQAPQVKVTTFLRIYFHPGTTPDTKPRLAIRGQIGL